MSYYPTILAGQRVTAGGLRSMLPIEAFKSVDTSRASTTTLTDDPDLIIPLEANATYWVEFFIHYAAGSTGQFQTTWGSPSGSTGLRACWGAAQAVNHSDPSGDGRWGVHGFATTVQYGQRTTAANQTQAYEAGHVFTTAAGNVSLQWAQVTSNATVTRVAVGSYARAKRVA